MNLPFISIVIPCYNYQDFVLNAIESCLMQDYKGEFETIVVDDNSTDSSILNINRYFRDKIRLIELLANSGYSAAKNAGIAKSRGELIVTLDADDMLTKDSLSARCQAFLDTPDALLVHAKAWVIRGGGDYDYWNRRLRKISCEKRSKKIHAQTVMMRRSVYLDYGLYDEKLRSRSDNEMWNRLVYVAGIGDRIRFLDHPVAFYRKHEKSMIEFRKINPPYNLQQTQLLDRQKALRSREGITRDNTRFLKR